MTDNSRQKKLGSTVVSVLIASIISQGAMAQSEPMMRQFDGKLIDLLPSLYNGDGITLATGDHSDHSRVYSSEALQQFNKLSVSLAGLSAPIFNLSPSNVYEYDPISEEYVTVEALRSPSFNSEYATTIGRGRIGIGGVITTREFSKINSVDLDNIVFDLTHPDVAAPGADICIGGPPGECHFVELDVVRLNINVDFRESVMVFGLAYGLTDTLEISLLAPLIDTEIDVKSFATVIQHESAANVGFATHSFDITRGADQPNENVHARRTGIGDITLNAKQQISSSWIPSDLSLAVGAEFRLPTGSEGNLQGLPHVGISPKILSTAQWSLADIDIQTNANLSYRVNATSDGTDVVRFAFGSTFEPGLKLFNGQVAFTNNIIGWKRLSASDISTNGSAGAIDHDHADPDHDSTHEALKNQTATQLDITFGVHVPLLKHGYVFYESRLPLNEVGFRADITHSFGFQVPF